MNPLSLEEINARVKADPASAPGSLWKVNMALVENAGRILEIALEEKRQIAELKKAIEGLLEKDDYCAKKINWGASFLDGRAIQLMNDAPIAARRALAVTP